VLRLQEKIEKLLLCPVFWNSDRELPSAILREGTVDRSSVVLPINHDQMPNSRARRWTRFPRVRRFKITLCAAMILFAKYGADKFSTLIRH
jgi:hypothetical protein